MLSFANFKTQLNGSGIHDFIYLLHTGNMSSKNFQKIYESTIMTYSIELNHHIFVLS